VEARRVLVVGDSLFAETLAQTLTQPGSVEMIGSAPTLEAARPLIQARRPDVVIVAEAGERSLTTFGQFLAAFPDLPLIRADLSADHVQVITSQPVSAHTSDLLAAIAALPKRS
jgi:chemotaxis response regulator CheB